MWLCRDSQPGAIRALLTPRDPVDPTLTYNDDFVELTLDTFHDQRHGFVFTANPLGIQTDALWTEDAGTSDKTWDERWESRGGITRDGYIVWMAIPFKSLRFPSGQHDWGITLQRYDARHDEVDYWPRVSSRVAGKLNQEANLTGVRSGGSGRNLKITPYAYMRNFRTINDTEPAMPFYQSVAAQGRIGGDLKWVLTKSMVLDATINPDFSQLESDQPQNTVNRRFAVYFPEKRPFFLENSNFFDSAATAIGLSQLVFTRQIADPSAGVKLSGKQGRWDLGMLVADDRSPGESVAPEDPDYRKHALVGIFRATSDLGAQSNVGVLFTDRELNGGFNRVGSLDTSLRLGANWAAFARGTITATRCVNASVLCLSGQSDFSQRSTFGEHTGSAVDLALEGAGRRFQLLALYQDISQSFHTDTGFVPQTDIRNLFGLYHFYWRPEGRRLLNWGPEITLQRMWDHSGQGIYYGLHGSLVFGFRHNTKFSFPILNSQSDTIRPQDFAGLTHNLKFVQNGVGIDFRTAPVGWLSFNTSASRQGAVTLVVPNGQTPIEGDEVSATSTISLNPSRRLQINNTYILDRVVHAKLGRSVFNNDIVRSEINFQYNSRLGIRLISQYNGLLANPQYSSLTTTRNANLDFLITYLVHPGTAFYVGSNSNFENVAPGLCERLPDGTCDQNGAVVHVPGRLRNDGRVFFVKLSYAFTL